MIRFFAEHKLPTSILAIVLSLTMFACSAQTILAYLEQVAPTVIAILNLVAAFGGPAVEPSRIAQINQEAANVIDLYKKFTQASEAAKPDALSQFNAAYAALQTNLTQILSTVRVTDQKKQAQVAAAVSAALLLFNQIQLLIPGSVPNAQQVQAARGRTLL